MNPISTLLRRIRDKPDRCRSGGATVYLVIDDHGTDEEPVAQRFEMTEHLLARNNDRSMVKTMLEQHLMSVFTKWRDNR